jgi:tRNA threonylcarbamoyl adenosine modification protein YeaZ
VHGQICISLKRNIRGTDLITNRPQTILAVEAAIAGGSLSIIRGGESVSRRCGTGVLTRAEELLPNIDLLLRNCDVNSDQLDAIAVSMGPGSFTGLRVGISTALGLSLALAKPHIGVPLLDAIAASIDYLDGFAITVPIGRTDICFQGFTGSNGLSLPTVGSDFDLFEFVKVNKLERVACHPDLLNRLRIDADLSEIQLHPFDPCLADYIGQYAANHPTQGVLEPIYVQNPRFA